jgi:hypothetical protein
VVTRAEFLRNNPNFAKMGSAERQKWLARHPDAAAVWRRINSGGGGESAGPASPPTNYNDGPPVWDPVAVVQPQGLPYYTDIDSEEADDVSDLNEFSSDTEAQKQQALMQWTTQERDINTAAPALYRRILNSSASRGMAHSSGHAYQDQQARSDVARSLSDIATTRNSSLARFAQMLAERQANFQRRQSLRAQRRASRAAGNPYA